MRPYCSVARLLQVDCVIFSKRINRLMIRGIKEGVAKINMSSIGPRNIFLLQAGCRNQGGLPKLPKAY